MARRNDCAGTPTTNLGRRGRVRGHPRSSPREHRRRPHARLVGARRAAQGGRAASSPARPTPTGRHGALKQLQLLASVQRARARVTPAAPSGRHRRGGPPRCESGRRSPGTWRSGATPTERRSCSAGTPRRRARVGGAAERAKRSARRLCRAGGAESCPRTQRRWRCRSGRTRCASICSAAVAAASWCAAPSCRRSPPSRGASAGSGGRAQLEGVVRPEAAPPAGASRARCARLELAAGAVEARVDAVARTEHADDEQHDQEDDSDHALSDA